MRVCVRVRVCTYRDRLLVGARTCPDRSRSFPVPKSFASYISRLSGRYGSQALTEDSVADLRNPVRRLVCPRTASTANR